MTGSLYHILFLCTGNSARSVLAEAILRQLGAGRFRASSAGSHPTGRVQPVALEVLRECGYDTSGLRSKSWDDLAAAGAPEVDVVLTVCASAAGEACPAWRGAPVTAHWGLEDPATFRGPLEAQRDVFRRTCLELERRIDRLVSLDLKPLDRAGLQEQLDAIGRPGAKEA